MNKEKEKAVFAVFKKGAEYIVRWIHNEKRGGKKRPLSEPVMTR